MLLDAFLPEHVTELAVDSIFMMPHLGVLSTVHPAAATEVFQKDCLVRLGTCVAPVGRHRGGGAILEIQLSGARTERLSLAAGDLRLLPLGEDEAVDAVLTPARGVDVGGGPGERVTKRLRGGVVGLVFDARGRRPMTIPEERAARVAASVRWSEALALYPS